MSPPGRPKGESPSAQREGSPVSPPGRPKGESLSAQSEGSPVNARRALILRVALVALLIAGTAWALTHRDLFDLNAFEAARGRLNGWAPAGFVLLFALATVLFAPGSLFGLAGGFLFGPVFGTLCNLAGATLGATLAFLAARYLASDWVARRAAGRLQQLLDGVQAEGWRFVALMRLLPLVPFNLLNYALGLTRIRVADYAITTFVCMVPGAAAYAWLGHAGREAAAGDAAALNYGFIGLGLLAAVLLLPRLIARLKPPSPSAGRELTPTPTKRMGGPLENPVHPE